MTTATDHLHLLVRLWPHLDDMLTTHHTAPWPPAGRLTEHLARLDTPHAGQVRELEVPAGQPPIRLDIHDTARAVETSLCDAADQIASSVQRPAARALPATPGDEIGLRLRTAALQDAADPARWSWTSPHTRTAPHAAVWLGHRLDDGPGPFRPLTPVQRDHIAAVAADAARRVESALDLVRRAATVDHPCPHCRGHLEVHGGDGQPPAVRCPDCGWSRTSHTAAA